MHEPLRILHLTPEFPPLIGGIGDYSEWLTAELAQLGHEVTVLTSPRSAGREAAGVSVSATVEHWDRRLWGAVAREVEAFKPDVLHVHYQPTMYGGDPAIGFLPWALAARRQKPAIVTTLHDMSRPASTTKMVGRLALETLMYGSDALVVTGDGALRGVAKRPGLRRRTTVVRIGSNIPMHALASDRKRSLRASATSDPDVFLLGYFGLMRRGKGVDVLLYTVAHLRSRGIPVELLVIGGIGDTDPAAGNAYRDGLLDQCRRLDLEKVVHFLGRVPPDEVSDLLQVCDLGVLPFVDGVTASHTSAFAALSHGLPLVATGGPNTPALFTDGAMALVPEPADPAALSRTIEELMKDAGRRTELAVKGREVADRFTRPAIAAQVAAIYAGVTCSGARREEAPAPLRRR